MLKKATLFLAAVALSGAVYAQDYEAQHIHVFNVDGTEVAFSPITMLEYDGVVDTLGGSGYGMSADHNGDILAVVPAELYRIDHTTGEAMNYVYPPSETSLCLPVADEEGNVYTSHILSGNPMTEWASDFTSIGNATEELRAIGRTMEVSPDGLTLWAPRFTTAPPSVDIYTRSDKTFDQFAWTDSLTGWSSESIQYNTLTGNLWLNFSRVGEPLIDTTYLNEDIFAMGLTQGAHYELLLDENNAITGIGDSVKWEFQTDSTNWANERPRGIVFSHTGDTLYLSCFGSSDYVPVERFVHDAVMGWQFDGLFPDTATSEWGKGTGVNGGLVVDAEGKIWVQYYSSGLTVDVELGKRAEEVPAEFDLSQNYPNPFNPTTTIDFNIPEAGFVNLTVYDMTGQKVATLIEQEMSAGQYSAKFDALNLASGTYVYELNVNGVKMTKKMMLMK
jgi:hypothetical protein